MGFTRYGSLVSDQVFAFKVVVLQEVIDRIVEPSVSTVG
jgi:hypothetical protein